MSAAATGRANQWQPAYNIPNGNLPPDRRQHSRLTSTGKNNDAGRSGKFCAKQRLPQAHQSSIIDLPKTCTHLTSTNSTAGGTYHSKVITAAMQSKCTSKQHSIRLNLWTLHWLFTVAPSQERSEPLGSRQF